MGDNKFQKVEKSVESFDRMIEIFINRLKDLKNATMNFSRETIKKINLRLKGKTIAVIGPPAAGKTTLFRVLKDKNTDIDETDYVSTGEAIKMSSIKITWHFEKDKEGHAHGSLKMKIRKPKDIGGEKAYRDAKDGGWSLACDNADFIFYVLDAKTLNDENDKIRRDYIERISDDFDWIGNRGQKFANGFTIVVLINKIDLIEDKCNEEQLDKWIKNNIIMIKNLADEQLGPFRYHFNSDLILPCSLLNTKTRQKSLSLAFKCIAEV